MRRQSAHFFRADLRVLLCAETIFFLAAPSLAAEKYEVTVERGVAAKMRDGVTLRADIYRPRAGGKFPVILERTPYNKAGEFEFGLKAAARGYVAIIQDVRERYSSEGEWYTFKNESRDGYDSVEWAAALPYSNGKVGMWGGSYVGATQMLTAIASPPHLAAIAPVVTASNYHNGWTYQGGAFEQWFNESWTSGLAQDTFNRLVQKNTNALQGIQKLPLTSYPLFNGGAANSGETHDLAAYFLDWLAHPSYDDYWKQLSIEDHHDKVMVPVFNVAAWYDIFLGGSLRNYMGIKVHGGDDAARNGQRLLVMIGGHAGGGRKIGDVDFGPQAQFDQDEIMLRWYDHVLKGIDNGEEREKPVKIFVMGKNVWREEDDWPLARAKNTQYYLHSEGSANGLIGEGSLSTTAPLNEPSDHFVYNPAEPVPTLGGPLCCDAFHLPAGPRDQHPDESRQDVLVFTTPAFKSDFEVTGPVSLELYASSTAVDTDFTAKLVDVWPNGFAQNLTEGIVRARYRNSQEKAELMVPGEIYKFDVDLWATSNVFLAGHQLRLEISSSNFPRFDRNLNTGEEQSRGTRMVKAANTILHDARHPSALILPVVPE
ncbi:MAG TPA: CocE/NonD family hydrolase [Terriglobia bacterium]|nr:CocE/NonD family hydrolase [Terriglobia bacterium]